MWDMWQQPVRCKDLASRTEVGFDWAQNKEVILCSLRLLIKYDGNMRILEVITKRLFMLV
jgi:hypothetical protein